MTWSYSGDPSSSLNDEVRFLLGDTDTDRQLISDEEIAYLLGKYPSATGAAIYGAYAIAAKLSKDVDEKTGDISRANSDLADHYRDLADQLKSQVGETGITIFAGGISEADVESRELDTDRVDGEFEIGMHDDIKNFSTDQNQ